MRKIILILFMFCLPKILGAQNLVPNGSFEDKIQCPYNISQIDFARFWFQPFQNGSSTDYSNKTCPFQPCIFPRTGFSVAGIHCFEGPASAEWREYIEGTLINPLDSGKSYCVSFHVKLTSLSNYAIDCIGMFFSKDSVRFIAPPMLYDTIPQIKNPSNSFLFDTTNWMKIFGSFTANGGEKFITIGNFYNNFNTNYSVLSQPIERSYYWVDDISVFDCNAWPYPSSAGNNQNICMGDSVQIGDTSRSEYIYWWTPTAGLSNDSIANPMASPAVTTTYYLHQKDFKFDETIDSVTVFVYPVLPDNAAGHDTLICEGGQAQLGITAGSYNYHWQLSSDLSDTAIANPTAMPVNTSTYILTISNTGCSKTDSVTVTVEPCDTAENSFTNVNAFTPNGDGKNDLFQVKGNNIISVHMKIINRWGQLLFEATGENPGWNGTYNGCEVNPGVYYYLIEVTFKDGEVRNEKGSVHVIR